MPIRLTQVVTRRRLLALIVGTIWLGGIAIGFALLARHENEAGISESAPRRWPQGSRIERSNQVPTLVMFAHPRCPCTRASIGELEKIVSRYPEEVSVRIVFLKPTDADSSWTESDQVTTAAALPGVHLIHDLNGAETRRFHAATSGQTLLYDRDGRLQFNGGITPARGHAGDNSGRSAIELMLSGAPCSSKSWPVFGCSLLDAPEGN